MWERGMQGSFRRAAWCVEVKDGSILFRFRGGNGFGGGWRGGFVSGLVSGTGYSTAAVAKPDLVGDEDGDWKLAACAQKKKLVSPAEVNVDEDFARSSQTELGFDVAESKFMQSESVQEKVQFLREWGLSEANLAKLQSQLAVSVRSAVLRISFKKLVGVATFLTDEIGLTKAQAAKCLFENVYLGSSSVDGCLRPKVEYFQQLGFSKEQLVKVIFRSPQVMTFNLERKVLPMTRKLIDIGLKPEDIVKAYLKHPTLTCVGINKINQIMQFLQGFGVVDVPKYFRSHPQMFSLSLDGKILQTTDFFRNELQLDAVQLCRVFKWTSIFCYSVDDNLRVKAAYFRSLGISNEDLAKMLSLYPCIFGHNMELSIKPKIDYLLNSMKKDVNDLVGFPQYMSYSLAKRIQPRHKYALSIGGDFNSLSYFLTVGDEEFKKRCWNRLARLTAMEKNPSNPANNSESSSQVSVTGSN